MNRIKEFFLNLIDRIWNILSKYLGSPKPEPIEVGVTAVEDLQLAVTEVEHQCCGKCKENEGFAWDTPGFKAPAHPGEAEDTAVFKEMDCCDGDCDCGGGCGDDCKCKEGEKCVCGDADCDAKDVKIVEKKVSKMRKVYHVVPNPNGGWLVKEEKNKNPSARADRKPEAVARAKELAKKAKLGQVIIHKRNGQIQTEYTYGEDPRRTKG